MKNQPSISSDLIRGHIDTIILRSILNEDKFAQQISDYIEFKSSDEYKINQATLYSSLKRLEKLKFVETYWHDIGDGRRKFFKITETGKQVVENNLSSWSYSRAIIDKLMGVSPTQIYFSPDDTMDSPDEESEINFDTVTEKAENKEIDDISTAKIETYAENISDHDVSKKEVSDMGEKYLSVNYAASNQNVKAEETVEKTESLLNFNEDQEKNFRTILNGLMSLSANSRSYEEKSGEKLMFIDETTLQDIENDMQETAIKTDYSEKQGVLKFNKTLDVTDYNANKSNFNVKTDYGDLTQKAAKEGYVLRISSKDSAVPKGNLLENKLNFISFALVFMLCVLESAILYFAFGKGTFVFLPAIIIACLPIMPLFFFSVKYFAAPKKSVRKKITPDLILTTAIIVFNVILAAFVISFVFNFDLTNNSVLLACLIYPVLYSVNAVIFFVLRYVLRNKKSFNCK